MGELPSTLESIRVQVILIALLVFIYRLPGERLPLPSPTLILCRLLHAGPDESPAVLVGLVNLENKKSKWHIHYYPD